MKQSQTFKTHRQGLCAFGSVAILARSVACALALTLAGCGQTGPLYQPLPEQPSEEPPAAAPSSAADETTPGRGD